MATLKLITLYLWLISMVILVSNPATAAVVPNDAGRSQIRGPKLTTSDAVKNANRVDPKRDCREMGSRSECSKNPKCRWCRSDALDDMCFTKTEAWRLPSQVFSCEF